jgi:hypothetical protein
MRSPFSIPVFLCVILGAIPIASRAEDVSFRRDVMPVLAKAGCSAGTCHGNLTGKGGFKLSLRGEAPDWDYLVLTHDQFARRIDRLNPESSLILRKATASIPHEGGRRFTEDSPEYRILLSWIRAGLPRGDVKQPTLTKLTISPEEALLVEPADRFQIKVTASFSDGSSRDVSQFAVYETTDPIAVVSHDGLVTRKALGETAVIARYLNQQLPVRVAFVAARPDFAWSNPRENNFIDHQIFAKLQSLRLNPSGICDDTTFLRRAYLDIIGLLPTVEIARRFAADSTPDKRARLIDALLQRPEFAECWALKWSDLLRNEELAIDFKGVQNFNRWIRDSIEAGKPMDQFARELITARGDTYTNPAANYYRALRDPNSRAEATAQVFLGTRLKCARCHNHPFERWTQDDYYGFSAFFGRINYEILENKRRIATDQHEFNGEQIVWVARSGETTDPRTDQPAKLRFMGTEAPALSPDDDRLEAAAAWVTSPENPLFARVMVNRVWSHLLGRGIVDPVDDFRITNPPSHPALLDQLAADFIEHHYDLRHAIRLIANSRTYQLASRPNDANGDDARNFSHGLIRRLTAEETLDGISAVTGLPTKFNGYPLGIRAGQIAGVSAIHFYIKKPSDADRFVHVFGKPDRLISSESERSGDITFAQILEMAGGPTANDLLKNPDNRLGKLLAAGKSPSEIIDDVFWSALARGPGEKESVELTRYLAEAKDPRLALEDIAWALMNSKEFLLRR